MQRSMVIALCACFLAAPAYAGTSAGVGKQLVRAPARSLSKGISGVARFFRQAPRQLSTRAKAAKEMRQLIKKHGHEKVTFQGKVMTLNEAYDCAKLQNSVDLAKLGKYSTATLSALFAVVAAWSKAKGGALEGGMYAAILGSAWMGVFAHEFGVDLKWDTHAARRDTLQAAHDSGVRAIPSTALSYYGVVK